MASQLPPFWLQRCQTSCRSVGLLLQLASAAVERLPSCGVPETVGGWCSPASPCSPRRRRPRRRPAPRRPPRHTGSEGRPHGDPALFLVVLIRFPFRAARVALQLCSPCDTSESRVSENAYKARPARLTSPWPDSPRRTLELVDIPSASRHERRILEHVARGVPLPLAYATDEALLYATPRTGRPLVLLAGHLDTVPAQENLPGRIEDGWVVGLGASDMKGGVAVMIELARWAAARPPLALDLAFLFFVREELPVERERAAARLRRGAARARGRARGRARADGQHDPRRLPRQPQRHAVFRGESAHSARPWHGVNAIDAAPSRGSRRSSRAEPLEVEVGGLGSSRC